MLPSGHELLFPLGLLTLAPNDSHFPSSLCTSIGICPPKAQSPKDHPPFAKKMPINAFSIHCFCRK